MQSSDILTDCRGSRNLTGTDVVVLPVGASSQESVQSVFLHAVIQQERGDANEKSGKLFILTVNTNVFIF